MTGESDGGGAREAKVVSLQTGLLLEPRAASLRVEHETFVLQGRELGVSELAEIRGLIAAQPEWSRYRLSRVLCERWNWRTATGQMKDMAARTLLLKLEERGLVQLPARRWASPNRMRRKRLVKVAHTQSPVFGGLVEMVPLEVLELSQVPAELALFETLLNSYHYLGHTSTVGMNLKYLVRDRQGRAVACALFGSAAWKCAARDRFIGWPESARRLHLQRITNNTRFLVMPWVDVRELASHVLGRIARRLRADWMRKYAEPLSLVETFVDTSRFTGVCYRAANWIPVGETTGRTRQDRFSRIEVPRKAVLVRPLVANFREELAA